MKWTKEEITEFNRLYHLSGGSQMQRIESRLDMPRFVSKHGEDKCKAMYQHIINGGDLEGNE